MDLTCNCAAVWVCACMGCERSLTPAAHYEKKQTNTKKQKTSNAKKNKTTIEIVVGYYWVQGWEECVIFEMGKTTGKNNQEKGVVVNQWPESSICQEQCNLSIQPSWFFTELILSSDLPAIVVAVFGDCWAPFHIERLMWSFVSKWTDLMHNIYEYVHIVSWVVFYLSSAVNPIIYSLHSTHFTECFRDLHALSQRIATLSETLHHSLCCLQTWQV